MGDAFGVGRCDPFGESGSDFGGFAPGQRALLQAGAQRFAVEQFGDGVTDSVLRSGIENRQKVGVRECRHGFGLTDEPCQGLRIVRQVLRQDLNGYVAIETGIASAVDLAHSTGADRRDDLIRS